MMAMEHSDIHVCVLTGPTTRGKIPIGMVLGRHHILDSFVLGYWTKFPWASTRNWYESVINMLNEMRKTTNIIFHAEPEEQPMANWILRHGIARRVGTLYHLGDKPLAEYQTSRPKAR